MHIVILQGSRSGGVDTPTLNLSRVVNTQTFGAVLLEYVALNQLNLTRVVNAQSFGAVDLQNVVVSNLDQTRVTNTNTFGAVSLGNLPFVAVNTETDTLLAAMTGTYGTTAKKQMDTLISQLKTAGVWSKLDWYGNANWALNEHDALLNWVNPSQTLVKVGGASWTIAQGLKGVNPMTSSGRYKSGWNVGSGPHSTSTSIAMFVKITSIDVPQNGMQPMGLFAYSTPGPSAPDGSELILSIPANSGSGGMNCLPFNGNTGFAVGSGLGVWGVSRSGSTNITVKNGSTLATDSVSGASSYTNAEGFCVAGSGPGFLAQRSFPGFQLYWGWGAALTAAEFGNVEASFQTALLPPDPESSVTGALLIDDDNNYLGDESGDYIVTDGA